MTGALRYTNRHQLFFPGPQMIMLSGFPRWIVAIPAKDEVLRIPDALSALNLAASRTNLPVCVLVYANNCLDGTAAVSRRITKTLGSLTPLPAAVEHAFDAFNAKNLDFLLSTDADARVDADLFREMERAFAAGADLVPARIACIKDPFEPCQDAALAWGFPGVVWRSRVRQLVETVRRGFVPKPSLHDDYGGAGLAARVSSYRALGGFRSIATNEDKVFVDAADARNFEVNRQSGAVVHVLARTTGRAAGGMADALVRDEIACAEKRPLFVEHHAVTIERVRLTASHAHAFAHAVAEWELAPDAITALDGVINSYDHRFQREAFDGGVLAR
jgi:hypothetical protein